MSTTTFGERLRELRRTAGLKQDALGDLSQGFISKLERGEAEPTAEVIEALVGVLRCTPRTLVGGTSVAHLAPAGSVVAMTQGSKLRLAYLGSALTGLTPEERDHAFRDAEIVRAACERVGAFLYEPRKYTDPIVHPNVSAENVYETDRNQVVQSDVLILYCKFPSFGGGQELEIALQAGLPVVLLVPRNEPVSRMVRGAYARSQVLDYANPTELKEYLESTLAAIFDDMALRKRDVGHRNTGQRVRELRQSRKLTHATVARALGIGERAVHALELDDELVFNPSITLLRRLAEVLRTTVSYLVDGYSPPREELDDLLRQSRSSFDRYVRDTDRKVSEAEAVWEDFVQDYEHERRTVAEARASVPSADDWARRFDGPSSEQTSLLGEDDQ